MTVIKNTNWNAENLTKVEGDPFLIPGSQKYVEHVLRWVLLPSPGQSAPPPSALTSGVSLSHWSFFSDSSCHGDLMVQSFHADSSSCPWAVQSSSGGERTSRKSSRMSERQMLVETGVEAYLGTTSIGTSTVWACLVQYWWVIKLLCSSLSNPISAFTLHHPALSTLRKKVTSALNPLQQHPLLCPWSLCSANPLSGST